MTMNCAKIMLMVCGIMSSSVSSAVLLSQAVRIVAGVAAISAVGPCLALQHSRSHLNQM